MTFIPGGEFQMGITEEELVLLAAWYYTRRQLPIKRFGIERHDGNVSE
ncbi:MAG: hypothetical protein ISR91_03150 [Candidatus Delongbacteria bacterium]|nr:hypothetical protein [bacterium]MBL7033119.1 hypothetical protein [Candidatus Delongbacteria bacterium]